MGWEPLEVSDMAITGLDESGTSEIFSMYLEFPSLCVLGKVSKDEQSIDEVES
jgi:hypothetical protein